MENKPSIRTSLEIEKKDDNIANNNNFSLNQSFYRFMINPNDNLVNSLWMKRFAKFLVFVMLMLGVWLGKAYGTVKQTKKFYENPFASTLLYLPPYYIFIIY